MSSRIVGPALALLMALACVGCPQPVYVDKDAPGPTHNGASWTTAWLTIQEGINDAYTKESSGSSLLNQWEVWVAEGTYAGVYNSGSNPSGTLLLKAGIGVAGGFAGTETQKSQRNWTTHPVILDGSTARSGQPAYHVVTGASGAVLDGFTIQGGRANGSAPYDCGGGLYNPSGASVTATNCIFTDNRANATGGAIYNFGASVTITNSMIVENSAAQGGGVGTIVGGTSPQFTNCTFEENTATALGGGMYVSGDGNARGTIEKCIFYKNQATYGGALANQDAVPTLQGCTFRENMAAEAGGAVSNSNSRPTFTNCTFVANRSDAWVTGSSGSQGYGGAILSRNTSVPILMNCTFASNSGWRGGSAVCNLPIDSYVIATNCIFWDVQAPEIFNGVQASVVSYCDIKGGFPVGTNNISVDPRLWAPWGGDVRLGFGSPCIDAGTATGAPSTDAAGYSRPHGSGYDIGSLEALSENYVAISEIVPIVPVGDPQSHRDAQGDYHGWIELYNGTGQTIDLYGWAFTNWTAATGSSTWTCAQSFSFPANQCLIVFAAGYQSGIILNQPHTDFQLNTSTNPVTGGGRVTLTSPSGTEVDSVAYDTPRGANWALGWMPHFASSLTKQTGSLGGAGYIWGFPPSPNTLFQAYLSRALVGRFYYADELETTWAISEAAFDLPVSYCHMVFPTCVAPLLPKGQFLDNINRFNVFIYTAHGNVDKDDCDGVRSVLQRIHWCNSMPCDSYFYGRQATSAPGSHHNVDEEIHCRDVIEAIDPTHQYLYAHFACCWLGWATDDWKTALNIPDSGGVFGFVSRVIPQHINQHEVDFWGYSRVCGMALYDCAFVAEASMNTTAYNYYVARLQRSVTECGSPPDPAAEWAPFPDFWYQGNVNLRLQ